MIKPELKITVCPYSQNKITENIFYVRNTVFVIEQKVSREEEFDEFESSSVHYLGTVNGQPAGTARWRITEEGIKLERFAVLDKYRNQKVGSQILISWTILMNSRVVSSSNFLVWLLKPQMDTDEHRYLSLLICVYLLFLDVPDAI